MGAPESQPFNETITEAFPKAESAFRDAFNQPDPAPKLLELITAHPDTSAILDLVVVYMEVVGESPTQFDKFAGALVKLQNAKGITVASGDGLGNLTQLEIADALYDKLLDIHTGNLVVARDRYVTPPTSILSTRSSLPYPSSTGFVTPTLTQFYIACVTRLSATLKCMFW